MFFRNNENRIKRKKEKLKNDISLLELKLKKQAYKKSLNSGIFSKRTIILCLMFTAIFGVMCLYVQYKTGYDTSSLFRIVGVVFGGELVLLLFKKVWSSDSEKISTFVTSTKNKISSKKKNKNSVSSAPNEDGLIENISTIQPQKSDSTTDVNIEESIEKINNSLSKGVG